MFPCLQQSREKTQAEWLSLAVRSSPFGHFCPNTYIPPGSTTHDLTGDSGGGVTSCWRVLWTCSWQHQTTMPLVFTFLTLINSVSFIYDLITCHAIINSRVKPCWSGGKRVQHSTGASQDQASKWLHFSNNPAYSPRETYSRNAHLQMSLTYTSSLVIMKNCLCFLFIYTRWWLWHWRPVFFPCHPHRSWQSEEGRYFCLGQPCQTCPEDPTPCSR